MTLTKGDSPINQSQAKASSLDLGGLAGLSEGDAAARLQQEGPNELPAQKKRGLWTIASK